jgi:hypothetical protein
VVKKSPRVLSDRFFRWSLQSMTGALVVETVGDEGMLGTHLILGVSTGTVRLVQRSRAADTRRSMRHYLAKPPRLRR